MYKISFTVPLIIILFFLSGNGFAQSKYDETYRNQFHFSVPENTLGSPLTLNYSDSIYQIYFQYNPYNLDKAYYQTGYATSNDLLHWTYKKIIWQQPDDAVDSMNMAPWWGTVVETDNSQKAWISRWGKGIYYTSAEKDEFSDEIATQGLNALKQSDPFVFWHAESEKWLMLAYERTTKTMHVSHSSNGINWQTTQSFQYEYGFPQLIELPVDNKPGLKKWILFSEGGKYQSCAFDGQKLTTEGTIQSFNYGRNIGGSVILNGDGHDKAMLISEIKSSQQADLPSNGDFSFPAEITLLETDGNYQVRLQPAKNIAQLFDKSYSWQNERIYPGLGKNILRRVKGEELYIKGTIQNINSDLFGFLLRSNRGNGGNEISVNVKKKYLTLIRKQVPFEPGNNEVNFEILLDRSVLEIYINDGEYVLSESISPSPEAGNHFITTSGGEIMVKNLEIFRIRSVW